MNVLTNSIAELDFMDALAYYKKISDKLAFQFIDQVEATKQLIGKNPLHIPIKYDNIRIVLLKQFPYHIHFFIDNNRKLIIIIAIIYASKDFVDFSKR